MQELGSNGLHTMMALADEDHETGPVYTLKLCCLTKVDPPN